MKLTKSLIFVTLSLSIHGCASAPRVLSVRSEPADAEVCIKGKIGNQHFKQAKNCIGSTPLELDSVTVTDDAGKKRTVHFNDLDSNKEQFFLVISRPGYAPQSMAVPSWEHFVTLREEQVNKEPAPALPSLPAATTKGTAKISSDPVGALVYVNDFLKGNTPYVLEGENGQTVRLKIEQSGYRPIERSITIENAKALEINLSMEKVSEKLVLIKEESRNVASQEAAK
ncbi:MAG: PEGA domain-containing protein [Bdellovibrionota bacterium]